MEEVKEESWKVELTESDVRNILDCICDFKKENLEDLELCARFTEIEVKLLK